MQDSMHLQPEIDGHRNARFDLRCAPRDRLPLIWVTTSTGAVAPEMPAYVAFARESSWRRPSRPILDPSATGFHSGRIQAESSEITRAMARFVAQPICLVRTH